MGRIRRAADVQVAEITQSGAIFIAHSASEVWIGEMLVASPLWHVLQNTEALLDGLLARRRQIAPHGQHLVPDVIALLRRHLLPHPAPFAHFLLLLRGQLLEALAVLQDALPFFRTQALLLVISVAAVIVACAARILTGRRAIGVCRFSVDCWAVEVGTVLTHPLPLCVRRSGVRPIRASSGGLLVSLLAFLFPRRGIPWTRAGMTALPRLWPRLGTAVLLALRDTNRG